jgi:hypothetical protein
MAAAAVSPAARRVRGLLGMAFSLVGPGFTVESRRMG